MVPLARALEAAGHSVGFACAKSFCPLVTALGLRAFPSGLDWLEWEAPQTFPELHQMSLAQQSYWLMTAIFADRGASAMVGDLLSICRAWQPDVIIRDPMEFGGCIAAERLGIPHATISVGLFFPAAMWHFIAPQLSRLRQTWGLSPDPNLDMLYRYLYLAFVPPSYQIPDFDLPPVVHSLRPAIFDCSGNVRLPDWVHRLPARPTVYATLGTVFNRMTQVFDQIIDGLDAVPVNLIITIGRNQAPEQFAQHSSRVHVERYIPQSLVFPHCDVVVTHGGFNTVMTAVVSGLPLLVLPLAADQPLHAARCVALKVGCALRPEQVTPQTVRESVEDLLNNEAYRQNIRRLQGEIDTLPGLDHAVELVTNLAVERAPQTT
jgi:UDP:flavonoid glycosyltransferase YjiC (YdhE family)